LRIGKRKGKPEVFHCTVCGECCTDFNIILNPWAEDGVVHLAQDESIGVEIWPWEAKILAALSKETNAGLVLMPSNLMLEKGRDTAVVLSYLIANTDCPFVVDKKCTVYENRPNVCRYFPVVLASVGVRTSGRCPETIIPKKRASAKENADILKRTYPDGIVYLQSDLYTHERMIDLFGRMEMEGKVEWDYDPDPGLILQKVQDQQWKDLLDFLIEIKAMTPKEVEDLVFDLLSIKDMDDKVDFKLLTL